MASDQVVNRIRMFYLYLFSGIGLLIFLFGIVSVVEIGMKTFIFPTQDEMAFYTQIEISEINLTEPEKPTQGEEESEEEFLVRVAEYETALSTYEAELKKAKDEQEKQIKAQNKQKEILIAKRNQELAGGSTLAIVGFLVLFYHWRIIQKESRVKKSKSK